MVSGKLVCRTEPEAQNTAESNQIDKPLTKEI